MDSVKSGYIDPVSVESFFLLKDSLISRDARCPEFRMTDCKNVKIFAFLRLITFHFNKCEWHFNIL